MMLQSTIAVIMILGSSLLTAWVSGDTGFPAILCILGLLGVQRRFALGLRPERHFVGPLLLLLLAILFSLHCRYAHVRPDEAAAFAWQTIARYFLASMILILFLRPYGTVGRGLRVSDGGWPGAADAHPQSAIRHPQSLPGLPLPLGLFHLGNALAAGQVLLLDDQYVVAFRLTELLSVTLVILYMVLDGDRVRGVDFGWHRGIGRPSASAFPPPPAAAGSFAFRSWLGSRVPLALLLLFAVNLGWIGGSVLYRHVETINFLPTWLSRGSIALDSAGPQVAHVGFSSSGRLSTILAIKEDLQSDPVLTVMGASNPTYLRARSFETYHQSAWHDLSYREAIGPEQTTPFGTLLVGRTNLFRLHGEEGPREVVIRHEASFGDAMFTPLGPSAVEAPLSLLMRDDDDIVGSPGARSRLTYRVVYGAAGRPPSGSQFRRMLAVSSDLDLSLRAQAIRIFRDCTTTAQKIDAVIRYFRTNYTYSLGLEVPVDRDAVKYFILEASTGYCEYFASGAAILLRLAGVPTRYVTGFLVTEPGDDRHTWVARNPDAHAWAEAWDAEREQWVIVEATTQEGLGDASLADELARGASDGRPLLARLIESLYEYGLFGLLGPFWDSGERVRAASLSLAAVLLAGGISAWAYRRKRLTSLQARTGRTGARRDSLLALHRLLAVLDRRARGLGYRRRPGETLHAFAVRLVGGGGDSPRAASLADWYRQYAGLRYRPAIDPAQVERLDRLARQPPARR